MRWNILINVESNRSFDPNVEARSRLAAMFVIPRLPRDFRICAIWFPLSRASLAKNVWLADTRPRKFNMAAKSFLVCLFQEKEEKLDPSHGQAAFVWMVWTFYYSPFPPVPVRFVYCNACVLVYRMRLSTHLRAMFLRKKMLSQQNRLARLERSQGAHFIMNA